MLHHRGERGQLVLTGSAVPADTAEITHAGAELFMWLTMRPMCLYESGDSSGEVSLRILFENKVLWESNSNLKNSDIY